MASIFTHPAPAIALRMAFGPNTISSRLFVAALAASVLPDLDVASFSFGIKYADSLGHRGFSHSLAFALIIGAMAFLFAPFLRAKRSVAFYIITLSIISHILLDALTTGGLGVAFFWPLDETRYFLPWRPIVVSPFSIKRFFSDWGYRVILSELRYVWIPCLAFGIAGFCRRRYARP